MKGYLSKFVSAINKFNGNEETFSTLRDIMCVILDDKTLREDELVKELAYIASRKMRTFGYSEPSINQNKSLADFKNKAIETLYKSNVYRDSILDFEQKRLLDLFHERETKRMLVSAPTSFGKTFLLREIIALKTSRYNNILLVFPTVALLHENTSNIKEFVRFKKLKYNIVNSVSRNKILGEKNIFILTPERTLKLLGDNPNLNIDFFFFDEVYKIDDTFSKDEEDKKSNRDPNKPDSDCPNYTKLFSGSRALTFRITLYLLSKKVKEFYLAGPYLNISDEDMEKGLARYIKLNNVTWQQIDREPTLKISVDSTKKEMKIAIPHRDVQTFPIAQGNVTTKRNSILKTINDNNMGSTLIYCRQPGKIESQIFNLVEGIQVEPPKTERFYLFLKHLRNRYSYRTINPESQDDWVLIEVLNKGFGIHHGKLPKYIVNEQLRFFNGKEKEVKYLFCTSTIIEGVNTNAKNIVILTTGQATAFDIKNIKGRAGRYYHHFIGKVFYTDKKQIQIETQTKMKLDFVTYNDNSLSDAELDNVVPEDLTDNNRLLKSSRDQHLVNCKIDDETFIKNRIIARDVQELIYNCIAQEGVFEDLLPILDNWNNIQWFVTKETKGLDKILKVFVSGQFISQKQAGFFMYVVNTYMFDGFTGLLKNNVENINKNKINSEKNIKIKSDLEKINESYLETFAQIRDIIEFKIPRFIAVFESIFIAVCRDKAIEVGEFDLSMIMKFFELGIRSAIGEYLSESGFPVHAIKDIENKEKGISKMNVDDAKIYLRENKNRLFYLDEYELLLLNDLIT